MHKHYWYGPNDRNCPKSAKTLDGKIHTKVCKICQQSEDTAGSQCVVNPGHYYAAFSYVKKVFPIDGDPLRDKTAVSLMIAYVSGRIDSLNRINMLNPSIRIFKSNALEIQNLVRGLIGLTRKQYPVDSDAAIASFARRL